MSSRALPREAATCTAKADAATLKKLGRNGSWDVLEVCYVDCPKAGWNAMSLYCPRRQAGSSYWSATTESIGIRHPGNILSKNDRQAPSIPVKYSPRKPVRISISRLASIVVKDSQQR